MGIQRRVHKDYCYHRITVFHFNYAVPSFYILRHNLRLQQSIACTKLITYLMSCNTLENNVYNREALASILIKASSNGNSE